MDLNSKIKAAKQLSPVSPVLVVGVPATAFGVATVLEANIPSAKLGIVQTAKGLKTGQWLCDIMNGTGSHQIIINNIDSIDQENQEKFYELLKYKAISNVELPADCRLIVTAKDIKNVSETILRLCLVVR